MTKPVTTSSNVARSMAKKLATETGRTQYIVWTDEGFAPYAEEEGGYIITENHTEGAWAVVNP